MAEIITISRNGRDKIYKQSSRMEEIIITCRNGRDKIYKQSSRMEEIIAICRNGRANYKQSAGIINNLPEWKR